MKHPIFVASHKNETSGHINFIEHQDCIHQIIKIRLKLVLVILNSFQIGKGKDCSHYCKSQKGHVHEEQTSILCTFFLLNITEPLSHTNSNV